MENIQIPSFSRRRRPAPTPPNTPATISSSTPASTSSLLAVSTPEQVAVAPAVIQVSNRSADAPSELTHAENPVVGHTAEVRPAAPVIMPSNISSDTSSKSTQDAGNSEDNGGPANAVLSEKSSGKKPMPEGGHDQSDFPPTRRFRTASFRVTEPSPPARFFIPEGESARISDPIPSVLPWRPLLSREDGSTIGPTDSIYKDPLTSFAFYKGFWTPKDLEIQNKLSFGEMFQRFSTAAMETLFGMFTFQKTIETLNKKLKSISVGLKRSVEAETLLEARVAELESKLRDSKKGVADLKAERDSLANERDSLRVERDSLKTERDSLHDEVDILKTEKSVALTERDSLKAEKGDLQRSFIAERLSHANSQEKLLNERSSLMNMIGRVEGGMRALLARFTRTSAIRYAEGYRDGFVDHSPPESESSSCAGPDELDASLDIHPPNNYQNPPCDPAENIFIECIEVASSGIVPPFHPLNILPLSTIVPSSSVAADRPMPADGVIHLDSPSKDDRADENGEDLDGPEEDGGENDKLQSGEDQN